MKKPWHRFRQLFRIKPRMVAADLHPDYLSTRFARNLGLEMIRCSTIMPILRHAWPKMDWMNR